MKLFKSEDRYVFITKRFLWMNLHNFMPVKFMVKVLVEKGLFVFYLYLMQASSWINLDFLISQNLREFDGVIMYVKSDKTFN